MLEKANKATAATVPRAGTIYFIQNSSHLAVNIGFGEVLFMRLFGAGANPIFTTKQSYLREVQPYPRPANAFPSHGAGLIGDPFFLSSIYSSAKLLEFGIIPMGSPAPTNSPELTKTSPRPVKSIK